jgi:hypothetical protein
VLDPDMYQGFLGIAGQGGLCETLLEEVKSDCGTE